MQPMPSVWTKQHIEAAFIPMETDAVEAELKSREDGNDVSSVSYIRIQQWRAMTRHEEYKEYEEADR